MWFSVASQFLRLLIYFAFLSVHQAIFFISTQCRREMRKFIWLGAIESFVFSLRKLLLSRLTELQLTLENIQVPVRSSVCLIHIIYLKMLFRFVSIQKSGQFVCFLVHFTQSCFLLSLFFSGLAFTSPHTICALWLWQRSKRNLCAKDQCLTDERLFLLDEISLWWECVKLLRGEV